MKAFIQDQLQEPGTRPRRGRWKERGQGAIPGNARGDIADMARLVTFGTRSILIAAMNEFLSIGEREIHRKNGSGLALVVLTCA